MRAFLFLREATWSQWRAAWIALKGNGGIRKINSS